jgi:uncharacterized protein (DUF885 family)
MNEKSNSTKKQVKRGGRRPGAGRKSGTPNKSTRELKELAGEYTERAVKTLVAVMEDQEAPPAARVAAADKLLDRGHGRPAVTVEANVGKLDPDLIHRLQTDMVERMARSRERQRQVLLERGFIDEDGNKLRD